MPVIYMDRASIESLTEKDIREIIDENSTDVKYGMLHDYYVGNHRILGENKKDSTAPNNRLVNNMAKYITDTATGYFVGEPIVYDSQNDEYLQTVQDIFDYNDEQDHNMELAKQCSICGSCFEMLYLDEDAKIRLARVPAANGIMICETDSGFSTPMAFIRTIISKDKDDNVIRKVEFWNSSLVMRFQSLNNGYLNMIAVEEHYWQDVPFVEYINNEERLGDFEGVITEIDAYNKVQSNTANYFQYNDDAILKVLKLGDVSSQDIADMKEKGAIILEDGGDVDWLLKTIDDTALENYKNRLREDIHTGANVPHMCDESFDSMVAAILSMSEKLSKKLDITDFKQGDVTLKVRSLDGIHPLIPVSSDRMKTEYLFKDGVTSGQEAGGFAPTENSKSINWIITPRKAPIAVSKTDKMRIFDPETNQKARAWAMDYRKFHDIWIPARKVEQCFVNVKEELAQGGKE